MTSGGTLTSECGMFYTSSTQLQALVLIPEQEYNLPQHFMISVGALKPHRQSTMNDPQLPLSWSLC